MADLATKRILARPAFDFSRLMLWLGVAAPVVYGATVVAGGAMIPGYSHFADPISSLTQAGRTGVSSIQSGFALYNLLLGIFAMAAMWRLRTDALWLWAFGLVFLTAACGVLMETFSQDPIGSPVTLRGTIHIALAGIESVATLFVLGLSVVRFHRRRLAAPLCVSVACLAVTAPFGLLTALAVGNGWPGIGLFERLTIGGFEVWVAFAALLLLTRPQFLARDAAPV